MGFGDCEVDLAAGLSGGISRHQKGRGRLGPLVVPGSPPPAPGLHRPPARGFLGRERRLRCGAASVELPRPRPAAPGLTSPRSPGGAGPRSRVPLQQPPPARS